MVCNLQDTNAKAGMMNIIFEVEASLYTYMIREESEIEQIKKA